MKLTTDQQIALHGTRPDVLSREAMVLIGYLRNRESRNGEACNKLKSIIEEMEVLAHRATLLTKIYHATYLISGYDGDTGPHVFSSMSGAIKFIADSHNPSEPTENPFNGPHASGWYISIHTLDNPKIDSGHGTIMFNGLGVRILNDRNRTGKGDRWELEGGPFGSPTWYGENPRP